MITPDNEKRLREQFLGHKGILSDVGPNTPIAAQQAVHKAVKQANIQTGMKDMLVLAVSSFFVLLHMLIAPFAARIVDHGIKAGTKTAKRGLSGTIDE